MKVLVTGAGGQLGQALQRLVPSGVDLVAVARRDLDLTDNGLGEYVRRLRPEAIINTAAYTDVDGAEQEPQMAFAANAEGTERLAAAAARLEARFVHVSTDFVFDGTASRPYRPDDPAHPLNVYGRSKLAGEQRASARYAAGAVIVRTAWLYAPAGRNFLTTMLRLMGERDALRIVHDQIGAPTSADSLARILWALVEYPPVPGVYHWTDAGSASWFDFATAIAEEAAAAGLLRAEPEITPIAATALSRPAKRPAYSVLDTTALAAHLGCSARPWRDEMAAALASAGESRP